MQKSIVLTLLCFLSLGHLMGQAILIEKGQRGTNLGAGFQTGKNYSGFQTGVGYSPNGITNFGTYLAYNSSDISDLSELSINPYIEFFVVKKDKQNPINVSISFDYNYTHGISETLDFFGLSINSQGIRSSIMIAPDFDVAQNLRVLPFGSFGYGRSWLTASNDFESETESSGGVFGSLGTILAFMNGENAFSIAPSINFSKGNTGFVMYISYNFAGKS